MPAKKRTARGRPVREITRRLRAEAVALLMSHWDSGREKVELDATTLADELQVHRTTAQRIVAEITGLLRLVKPAPGGISIGADSYYEQHIPKNTDLKDTIARRVAQLIPAGTSVACSAGTTIVRCVRQLAVSSKYVVAVTNNVGVTEEIGGREMSLVLTGGNYVHAIHACAGEQALQAFDRARCTTALVGVSGITADGGLYVAHREEVEVLLQIVHSAIESIIIATDLSKLTRQDVWNFATIPQILQEEQPRTVRLVTNDPESVGKSLAQQAEKVLAKLTDLAEVNESFVLEKV